MKLNNIVVAIGTVTVSAIIIASASVAERSERKEVSEWKEVLDVAKKDPDTNKYFLHNMCIYINANRGDADPSEGAPPQQLLDQWDAKCLAQTAQLKICADKRAETYVNNDSGLSGKSARDHVEGLCIAELLQAQSDLKKASSVPLAQNNSESRDDAGLADQDQRSEHTDDPVVEKKIQHKESPQQSQSNDDQVAVFANLAAEDFERSSLPKCKVLADNIRRLGRESISAEFRRQKIEFVIRQGPECIPR
ncbi:hypothetical protein [Jeongeupia sp. USM3]|uniref:hypothetical protein n=1 Tax=Jeongeupia sp. USM3 TaxID=1906741 RepID=UPI0011AB8CAC|nr:hypothetical protein [Jeongeupia sp. USM3]